MKIKDWLPFKSVPQISAETLHKQLSTNNHNLFLLDVRSNTEWNLSHIPKSECIPVFNVKISQIPKDKTIICICLTAHRSTPIARELLRCGYEVYELSGGMRHWWKQQLPTNKT